MVRHWWAAVAASWLLACGNQATATPTGQPQIASPAAPEQSHAAAPGAAELFGDWTLVRASIGGSSIDLLADSPVTMTVTGTRLSGQSACNNYQSDVRIDAATFVMGGQAAMSAMACENARMLIDDAYIRALRAVRAWNIDQGRLVLRGPAVELVYELVVPVPLDALTDRAWVLQTLKGSDGADIPARGTADLELGSDGGLSGSTGCRTITGTYVVQRGEILATRLSLNGACPRGMQAQDGLVVEVLGDGFRTELVNDSLVASKHDVRLIYVESEAAPKSN